MTLSGDNTILDIIKQYGPLSTQEIVNKAKTCGLQVEKEYINSLLYGFFREAVVRERDTRNIPVWRIKTGAFQAGKGYESSLAKELLRRSVVQENELFLDYTLSNRRTRKTYHLDIALIKDSGKYNIEVDGFEHMRADARLSIQQQIVKKGDNSEIDIDWMDHASSYMDFKLIDSKRINSWCIKHLKWCITYHEELLWPHDISRNIFLIDNGWSVMRLWNMEIKNNLSDSISQISEWIR
jgi:hypothetical protein